MGILKNRIRTFFGKPQNIILLIFGIMLTFSTVAPVVAIVKDTLQIHPGTIDQHLTGKASGYSIVNYIDLFTSKLAMSNLWKPLINTFWQYSLALYPFYMAVFLHSWLPEQI